MERGTGIRISTLILVIGLGVVPGFACKSEDPSVQAEAAPEAAQAERTEESPALEVARIDTVGDDRSVGQRLRDASIAARIRLALVDESNLAPFDFEADVSAGRVALSGTVQTAAQRDRASEIARQVEGVRSVRNELTALEAPSLAAERTAPEPEEQQQQETREAARAPSQSTAAPEPEERTPEAASQPAASGEVYHTVKSGESLWIISQKYGTPTDRIKSLNNLRSNNLQPGQRLRVK